ncbi:MAG: hypothetical protein HY657_05935 [Acidobacteria bacterium]|nr:hypothetical protein [Acidobacteriota bacterium]
MTEQELRALVREAVARHGGLSPAGPAAHAVAVAPRLHASHGVFLLPSGADADGPCLIEPAVRCNHCGYCKSYGH